MTAQDYLGATLTGYSGTVHFSCNDGQAQLPADATLTDGVGYFAAIMKTAGSRTISVTDMGTGQTNTSSAVTVDPLAANHLALSAPSVTVSDNAFSLTVTTEDRFGNTATSYVGTVHFRTSDMASAGSGGAERS